MQWLLPPFLFFGLAGLAFLMAYLIPAPALPPALNPVGIAIAVAGIAINLASVWRFSREKTNLLTFNEPGKLVVRDAFRFTRNPMYLGMVLALLGFALWLGSAAALVAPLGFFIACNFWYIPFEEQAMKVQFGTQYHEYCKKTRRWI